MPYCMTLSIALVLLTCVTTTAKCEMEYNATTGQVSGDVAGKSILELHVSAFAGKTSHSVALKDAVIVTTDPNRPDVLAIRTKEGVDVSLSITGTIRGGDIFPCSPCRPDKQLPMIRSISGRSHNALNTGVYCRSGDWAVQLVSTGKLDIAPAGTNQPSDCCKISANGRDLRIEILREFFHTERGLEFFRPNYSLPDNVPAGWISWKAYRGKVTEKNIQDAADWIAGNLKDYGLGYLIIDDGWFVGSTMQLTTVPADVDWTSANGQFPGGMKATADYIHSKGLKAGIWLSPFGCSGEQLQTHPDWWIHAGANGPVFKSKARWHGLAFMDATNTEAVEKWLLRGIRAQLANGYDYLKIDGQMHVAYDGYSKTGDYFTARHTTWQEALRKGWSAIRRATDASDDVYVLSCWSRVPELIGHPMAIRIGADKASTWEAVRAVADDLGKWFHEHNLIWCVDPDHICLVNLTGAQSRTWATMVALTGTHLTFSDKPEVYTGEKLDIMRRILPVIGGPATRPGNLYQTSHPAVWTLEVDRPFDRWLVVANSSVGKSVEILDFAALGLDPDASYSVYDFWNRQYKGVFRGSFRCGKPGEFDTLVFGIRPTRPHPWIVATNRHISQGAVDLVDVAWDANKRTLSGRSLVVKGDPYVVTIHVPGPWKPKQAIVGGMAVETTPVEDAIQFSITPDKTGKVSWRVEFDS